MNSNLEVPRPGFAWAGIFRGEHVFILWNPAALNHFSGLRFRAQMEITAPAQTKVRGGTLVSEDAYGALWPAHFSTPR